MTIHIAHKDLGDIYWNVKAKKGNLLLRMCGKYKNNIICFYPFAFDFTSAVIKPSFLVKCGTQAVL